MNFFKLEINRHDLELVTELIYETDENLFKTFLDKDHDMAVEKLKKLVVAGKNSYGHENVYVAENGKGELIGVIVAFRGDEIKLFDEAAVYWKSMNFIDFIKLTFIKPIYDRITASHIEGDDFYIGNLAVVNTMRGKGIGTKLLNKSIYLAREKKCKRLLLDVIYENVHAKRFYEKMGFRVCGEKKFKFSEKSEGTYGMEYIL